MNPTLLASAVIISASLLLVNIGTLHLFTKIVVNEKKNKQTAKITRALHNSQT